MELTMSGHQIHKRMQSWKEASLVLIICGDISYWFVYLSAAALEQSDYERHKAEVREQTAQVLGQQAPARVGEGKKIFFQITVAF